METIYEQTEYDRITDPIRKRYERISRERGVTVIPLAAGESAPVVEDEPLQVETEPDVDRRASVFPSWMRSDDRGES